MRKIILSVGVFLFSIFFFIPFAFAQTAEQGNNVVLNQNQTINGDYFSSGQTVSIHGVVNGDVYTAGGNVLIDGTVNGDILAGGGNVTVSGSAHNIRVAGGQVLISGTASGNVTALGGNVTISDSAKIAGSVVSAGGQVSVLAPVGKGVTLAGGQTAINNSVGADVLAAAGQLTIGSSAIIPGKLTYLSSNNANIDPGAQIAGGVNHMLPPVQKNKQVPQQAAAFLSGVILFTKLISFVTLFVLGVIVLQLFPVYSESALNTFVEHPWICLGLGILTGVAIPVVCIILLITVLGIGFIPIVLASFFLVAEFGKIYAIVGFGKLFFQRNRKKTEHLILTLLVGLIIYEIVTLLPIVGQIVWIAVGAMGIGAIMISEYTYAKLLSAKKLL